MFLLKEKMVLHGSTCIKEIRILFYIKSNSNIQLLNNLYFLGESEKF